MLSRRRIVIKVCLLLTFLLEYMMNFYGEVEEEGKNHIQAKPYIILTHSVISKSQIKPNEAGESVQRSCSENRSPFHSGAGKLHPDITKLLSPRKLTGKVLSCFPHTDTFAADLMRMPADDLFTKQYLD